MKREKQAGDQTRISSWPALLPVVMSIALVLGMSAGTLAQDAVSPATEEALGAAPVAPEAAGPNTGPASVGPDAAPREEPAPNTSMPDDVVNEEAGDMAAEESPPRPFLDDPAGALTNMFSGERQADLPRDLSPWGMFLAADRVVKAVIIGLVFASLVTWTVWLAKSFELAIAKRQARRALDAISAAAALRDVGDVLVGRRGVAALMVQAAGREMRQSGATLDHAGPAGVKERVASRLVRLQVQAGRRMARGTGVLATIGSTAPFVGLFGTVWGIMNAFIGISEAQTTNLAVVAPGIAEALLATALGLVAAIPAVVIYNVFARSIAGYRQLLADIAATVERMVSRDLDGRRVPAMRREAAE